MAVRVGSVRRVVCASPAYLARRGRPKTPADLARHDVVSFESLPASQAWHFAPRGGRRAQTVAVRPRLAVNTAEAAIDAAVAGVGLTHVLSYQAAGALASGQLALVLRAYEPEPVPVSLLYTDPKRLPLKTRSFIDFAVPRLRKALGCSRGEFQRRNGGYSSSSLPATQSTYPSGMRQMRVPSTFCRQRSSGGIG